MKIYRKYIECRYLCILIISLLPVLFSHASQRYSTQHIEKVLNQGDSLYFRQQYVSALELYVGQLAECRHIESDSLYLTVLSRIGTVYDSNEDFRRAFYYYDKVLRDDNAYKYKDIIPKVLIKIVIGHYNRGNVEEAEKFYDEQLRNPVSDKIMAGYYELTNRALIENLKGNKKACVRGLRNTLQYCEHTKMPPVYSVPLMMELAGVYGDENMNDSAEYYLKQACELTENYGLDGYRADSYKALSEFYQKTGDRYLHDRYDSLYTTSKDLESEKTRLDEASLYLMRQQDMEAREEINSLNDKMEYRTLILWIILGIAVMLVVFVIYSHRQHVKLRESYESLIKKNDEIFKLESQTTLLLIDSDEGTATADSGNEMDGKMSSLLDKINAVMDNIDIITQPTFSLADLCKEVGSNTKYVSSLINEAYGKNFRTLLNERRIREATRRLSGNKKYEGCSVSEIAESLGYGSPTVFINAFKKIIGMTPAVYRKYKNDMPRV